MEIRLQLSNFQALALPVQSVTITIDLAVLQRPKRTRVRRPRRRASSLQSVSMN